MIEQPVETIQPVEFAPIDLRVRLAGDINHRFEITEPVGELRDVVVGRTARGDLRVTVFDLRYGEPYRDIDIEHQPSADKLRRIRGKIFPDGDFSIVTGLEISVLRRDAEDPGAVRATRHARSNFTSPDFHRLLAEKGYTFQEWLDHEEFVPAPPESPLLHRIGGVQQVLRTLERSNGSLLSHRVSRRGAGGG